MAIAVIEPSDFYQILLWVFGGVFVLSAIVYGLMKARRQNDTETIQTYKGLAESRREKIAELEGENQDLAAQLKRTEDAKDAAERAHSNCTQEVLRLIGRQTALERCINRLERAGGLPETNFDDPIAQRQSGAFPVQ